jgi:hypothetical protein
LTKTPHKRREASLAADLALPTLLVAFGDPLVP